MVWVGETGMSPTSAPPVGKRSPLHEFAPPEPVHARVLVPPALMKVGVAVKITSGAGPTVTVTLAVSLAAPAPSHVRK